MGGKENTSAYLLLILSIAFSLQCTANTYNHSYIDKLNQTIGVEGYNWIIPFDVDKNLSIHIFLLERILIVKNSNNKVLAISKIGPGSQETPTPTGEFTVTTKSKHHISREIEGAVMPFSIFIGNDGIALHAGDYNSFSNGCIRLPVYFAETIFELVDLNVKVKIYDSTKKIMANNLKEE